MWTEDVKTFWFVFVSSEDGWLPVKSHKQITHLPTCGICFLFCSHFNFEGGFFGLHLISVSSGSVMLIIALSSTFQAVFINIFCFLLVLERKRNRTDTHDKLLRLSLISVSLQNIDVEMYFTLLSFELKFNLKWQGENLYVYHFSSGTLNAISVK